MCRTTAAKSTIRYVKTDLFSATKSGSLVGRKVEYGQNSSKEGLAFGIKAFLVGALGLGAALAISAAQGQLGNPDAFLFYKIFGIITFLGLFVTASCVYFLWQDAKESF